jgi:ketosteroid isomerase-like protein
MRAGALARASRAVASASAVRRRSAIALGARDTARAMSQENVEVFRRAGEAFNRRDIDAITDLLTEDFEFIPYLAAVVEKTTTYRGRDGLRQYGEDADPAWENFQVRVDEIRDLGDRVIAFGEIRGRGRASGLDTRVSLAWVADFHQGKISRLQSYGDATEALEAAGLSE